jgi:hypothetical protein
VSDTFTRTGTNAELDSALALMERVIDILDGAIGDLEDAGQYAVSVSRLERAQEFVKLAADCTRR